MSEREWLSLVLLGRDSIHLFIYLSLVAFSPLYEYEYGSWLFFSRRIFDLCVSMCVCVWQIYIHLVSFLER